jgi:transcriptional regulator with XRE-family HTH domain
MKTRDILAKRLRAGMEAVPAMETQAKVSKAAHVTQSTVWRVLEAEVGASVDVVDSLAKAFGVPPITMLCEGNELRLLEMFKKLNAPEQEKVLSYMYFTLQTQTHNMPSPAISWETQTKVESPLKAAHERAAARPPNHWGEDAKSEQGPGVRKKRH